MKYRIAVKNFKQFNEFTGIEFNDLTFITGKNNSGKSTFIKALLLFLEYLRSDNQSVINLKTPFFNLGNFKRIKNLYSNEECIRMDLFTDNMLFSITIKSLNPDDTEPAIQNLTVQKHDNLYCYDFENNRFIFSKLISESLSKSVVEQKKIYIDFTEKKLALINNEIIIKIQNENLMSNDEFEVLSFVEGIENSKIDINIFISNKNLSVNFFRDLNKFTEELNISYFQSKNFRTSSFHIIDDKFDALSQILKKYSELGLDKNELSSSKLFIEKWMSKDYFDLGEKIKVINHSNEAFELLVIQNQKMISTSDLGTGSIQCLSILIALGNIIQLGRKGNRIIFIEEPEQNLHPNFQSMLSEIFYEVSIKYGITVFVETHSEYIIRNTQRIGLKNNLFEEPATNPFTVIYFDKEYGPYEMKYLSNGKFDKNFGDGFFNEVGKMNIEIIKYSKK